MYLDFSSLNVFGWIVLGLAILGDITTPMLFGRERKPYSFSGWIGGLIGTLLFLLALGVVQF